MEWGGQHARVMRYPTPHGKGRELVIRNPKLKLMDQVREVMRIRHYAIRTEEAYCDRPELHSERGLLSRRVNFTRGLISLIF